MSAEEQKHSPIRDPQSAIRGESRRGHRPAPTLDTVTTINTDGSRRDVHPADVSGRYTRARIVVAWVLITVYLTLPWIPINGAPAVFLDLAERRFHFFGYTLAAQDTWLLFFGVTGLGFALFFVTALFGRLWCGWACPQTVFLEHVFRRIERWIDGDATQRRALAAAPFSAAKAARRTLKHGIFIVISLAITHLFLAYYVSIPRLWEYMRQAPGEHWTAFLFVFVAAGILYFNFAWFREQLCIVICPYGRLQSALTDDHSLVIGYDVGRGEPRGKLRSSSVAGAGLAQPFAVAGEGQATTTPTLPNQGAPGTSNLVGYPGGRALGDCIDCNRCVQVCPTGIDIRQGLQLECIGCAACIDACDEVMTRVHRPTGLIRYDSHVGLHGGKTRWWRPRTLLYGLLLIVGASVAIFAFSSVKPASFLVYRMSGAAYFVDRNVVRDQFLVRVVNKRSVPVTFVVSTADLPAYVHRTGFAEPVTVPALGEQVSPLVLTVNRRDYTGPFRFSVRLRDETKTYELSRAVEFMGPDSQLLHEEDEEHGVTR